MEIQRSCATPVYVGRSVPVWPSQAPVLTAHVPRHVPSSHKCTTLYGQLDSTDITGSSQRLVISGQLKLVGSGQNPIKSKGVNPGRVGLVRLNRFNQFTMIGPIQPCFSKLAILVDFLALLFVSDHGPSQSNSANS